MAFNTSQNSQEDIWLSDTSSEDSASVLSNETDDGAGHPPEKILAEYPGKLGLTWYLVKWKDCAILRSSWENDSIFRYRNWLYRDWIEEKEAQKRGQSSKLDIDRFNRRVEEVEKKEKQRRRLRRLKRKVEKVVEIVTA
jgi:hypothetical protein